MFLADLQIAVGAVGHVAAECLFGSPAAHEHRQLFEQELAAMDVLVFVRQDGRGAEGLAAGDDADFVKRGQKRLLKVNDGVAGFVVSNDAAFVFFQDHGFAFLAKTDFVPGFFEFGEGDRVLFRRALRMAASLMRLARSAPDIPEWFGQSRPSGLVSGAHGRLFGYGLVRMARRPLASGRGT